MLLAVEMAGVTLVPVAIGAALMTVEATVVTVVIAVTAVTVVIVVVITAMTMTAVMVVVIEEDNIVTGMIKLIVMMTDVTSTGVVMTADIKMMVDAANMDVRPLPTWMPSARSAKSTVTPPTHVGGAMRIVTWRTDVTELIVMMMEKTRAPMQLHTASTPTGTWARVLLITSLGS